MSHHLKELRLAGRIRTENRGRSIYCSVEPAGLELLREFLAAPIPCDAAAASPAACCPR